MESVHQGTFPSAPTTILSRLALKKQRLLNRGLSIPPMHGKLRPHQVDWLTFYLSKPLDTQLLKTSIAALGPPLTRSMYSNPPNCLCDVHTWLELRWIEELTYVVGQEMITGTAKLRGAPREMLSRPTKKHLKRLEPYHGIFSDDRGFSGDGLACSEEEDWTKLAHHIDPNLDFACKACQLSYFFQVPKAVRGLEILAKGRKKRDGLWPEVIIWLDPKPDHDWAKRWKRQANYVLRDRSKVNRWLKQGGWSVTTDQKWDGEVDMSKRLRESNIFDAEGGYPRLSTEQQSLPLSSSDSASGSASGSLTYSSSASTLRNSTYTWENELLDEYKLNSKLYCYESAPKLQGDDENRSKAFSPTSERHSGERAISYMEMIGKLGSTQTGLLLPERQNLSSPHQRLQASCEEDDDGSEYSWNSEDEGEGTYVSESPADNMAGSYIHGTGDRPITTMSNFMKS